MKHFIIGASTFLLFASILGLAQSEEIQLHDDVLSAIERSKQTRSLEALKEERAPAANEQELDDILDKINIGEPAQWFDKIDKLI